jgi:outer membrane protein OmpA-like peptidoglycan-associated protein
MKSLSFSGRLPMFAKTLTLAAAIFLTAVSAKASEGGYKIRGYLASGEDAKFVVVEAGRTSGVTSGEVFRAVRPARGGMNTPIETGLLKVIAVHENESIAEVTQQGTPQSVTLFGGYADVMAGDVAMGQRISIVRAKALAPEVTIRFSQLFDDPKGQPTTFELTPGGRERLREVAAEVASIKAGMLMIEGHTDQKGGLEQNQIESYQRALTIRQYLIDELGFDENRVTAIGLGESEPISDVILPGNADRSRRIVLKVVPIPGNH